MIDMDSPQVQTGLRELIAFLSEPPPDYPAGTLRESLEAWDSEVDHFRRETPQRAFVRRLMALCIAHKDLVRAMIKWVIWEDCAALIAELTTGENP